MTFCGCDAHAVGAVLCGVLVIRLRAAHCRRGHLPIYVVGRLVLPFRKYLQCARRRVVPVQTNAGSLKQAEGQTWGYAWMPLVQVPQLEVSRGALAIVSLVSHLSPPDHSGRARKETR